MLLFCGKFCANILSSKAELLNWSQFLKIKEFLVTEKIDEDFSTISYRATRASDAHNVIIKTCKISNDYHQLARLKHEYSILKDLQQSGVVNAISLEKSDHNLVLALEDARGVTLGQANAFFKNDLKKKLKVISSIVQSLHYVHQQGIIHRDLQPKNILVLPDTLEVKLTGFSHATRFSKSQGYIQNGSLAGHAYAYMAPEQTGRMNRSVDSQSDLYSLGVVFYELLTGKLPFEASQAFDLIYAHIATTPVSPDAVNPSIPHVVSSIILKLLSKNPEDRYRSAIGLHADIERCIEKLSLKSTIADFPIGEHDLAIEFRVTNKIFGRENEVEQLLSSFNKVTTGLSEVMFVSGYSGVGKTSLVTEIYKPVIAKHGYFISGKFDQFKQNIPYSAIIQAYQDFIRQILTESEATIHLWKTKILDAVRSNGQVVINVIPELELIIGKQPKLPALDSAEAENRFTLVFTEFQKALCRPEHPVVMFIDDLQWVDSASLKLIQMLVSQEELRYLFFIGAYRDNEVDQTHKLRIFLNEIQKSEISVHSLVLRPLDPANVNKIVSTTIGCSESESLSLSTLIFEKTQGNPFFVNQFLHMLYDHKYIQFSIDKESLVWNLETIRAQNITDNVVELMSAKIKRLSSETRELLKLASCVGNIFDFNTVTSVSELPFLKSVECIIEAVKEGLIIPSSDVLSTLDSGEYAEHFLREIQLTFKFLHDRVHQAAYELSSLKEKKLFHLKIGNLLLKRFHADKEEDLIFEIVNHLNLTEPPENIEKKIELSQLNLHAGKKAKTSSAYGPALRYLSSGLGLLPPETNWESNYQLFFDLYLNSAEALSALSRMKEADDFFQILIQKSKTSFDRGVVYDVYSIFLQSSGKAADALNISKKGLELFGINFPVTQSEITKEVETMMEELSRPDVLARLQSLPKASAQDVLIGRLYDRCNVGTYFADPQNLPFVICKNLKHVLDFGTTPESGLAIAWFAMILGMKDEKRLSFDFGDVGLKVMSQFDDPYFKGKTDMITHGQSLCWRQTFREGEQNLNDAFLLCHSNGELQYASYARIISYIATIAQSSDCLHVLESLQLWHDYCDKYVPLELGQAKIRLYLMKGLVGLPREEVDAEKIIAEYKAVNNATDEVESLVELARIATLYGDYKVGYDYYLRAEPIMVAGGAGNLLLVMLFYHGYAICCARLYAESKDGKYLAQLNEYHTKLKKWAELNPVNFRSYYTLVEAEKARAFGEVESAVEFYTETISHAMKHDYILLAAYANEYLAELYSSIGSQQTRTTYAEAIFMYEECNAKDKSNQLRKIVKMSLDEIQESRPSDLVFAPTFESELLDITSIMKTVEVLSSTIVLDDFIRQSLRILVENAGAQRVVLMTVFKDELVVEADAGPTSMSRIKLVPIESYSGLPLPLINLVKRKGEIVVLDDVTKNAEFYSDPYFKINKSRSVLCMPMFRLGKLHGILYFENNLTPGVFSEQRLQVLKIIATQVAISLENARFYEDLEHKVKERTDQLELERSKTVYASKLAMLGQMASGVAHEVNNPLMIIDGHTHRVKTLIDRPELDLEQIRKSVSVIETTSNRIKKIVKSLLLVSGYSDKKADDLLNVSDEIFEALSLCSEKLKSEGIELKYTEPKEEIEVYFTSQQFKLVLISLINNSFDAIRNSRGEKWIQVDLKATSSRAEISVTDSGQLMSKEIQEKLFLPFFTTKDVGSGMGLSLSVAKGILNEYSGTIYFDPRGIHNRFVIELPREKA